jgi:hypothetical protein
MHAPRMVSMFALVTLLPLTTLAAPRQAGSNPTVANKVEIIAYVFPRDRVLGPNEVAAKKLTRINYAWWRHNVAVSTSLCTIIKGRTARALRVLVAAIGITANNVDLYLSASIEDAVANTKANPIRANRAKCKLRQLLVLDVDQPNLKIIT